MHCYYNLSWVPVRSRVAFMRVDIPSFTSTIEKENKRKNEQTNKRLPFVAARSGFAFYFYTSFFVCHSRRKNIKKACFHNVRRRGPIRRLPVPLVKDQRKRDAITAPRQRLRQFSIYDRPTKKKKGQRIIKAEVITSS